jgi:YfiH family protein
VSVAPWAHRNLALHVGDDPQAVLANRVAVAGWFGTAPIAFPEQVHGPAVAVLAGPVTSHDWSGGVGCDAVVTATVGQPVGVLVADCMPVLLADPTAGVVGAVHAGRRGLAGGVLQATVAAMTALGADPQRTAAVIGPSICGRCYEVPAPMRDEVAAAVPGSFAETRSGTAALDLAAGAEHVLRATGVGRVKWVEICTAEDERFYSYRRDGQTGRFAGVVMRPADG